MLRGVSLVVVGAANAFFAVACKPVEHAAAPTQPKGWDEGLRLTDAVDENPDAHIVEVALHARMAEVEVVPGKRTNVLTYDGGIPGPLIRARAGDRLIVHFYNALDVPTTVHWHGVRLPNAMDGVPEHTQPDVPPGGSFDYDFVVPDAGLFWYHPHVNSAVQVGSGLYGALLVEEPVTETAEPTTYGDELVLVLSDLAVDEAGTLRPGNESGDLATLFGREGELILTNGKVAPTLRARAGLRQRWRIVNAAKSRYFQLAMEGHRFTRIGGDGGLIATPVESDMIVLTPGERADVLVTPRGAPGERVAVRWVPFDRGYGSTDYRDEETVFNVELDDADEVSVEGALPMSLRKIKPTRTEGATEQSLALTEDLASATLELGINGQPAWLAPPLYAELGSVQVWTVTNTFEWAHPFHLHGYFFQVLDVNGVAPEVLEWKDTVNVPVDGTVRIAILFDERPGMWMFHCHILDHADAGMMGMVEVAAAPSHAGH